MKGSTRAIIRVLGIIRRHFLCVMGIFAETGGDHGAVVELRYDSAAVATNCDRDHAPTVKRPMHQLGGLQLVLLNAVRGARVALERGALAPVGLALVPALALRSVGIVFVGMRHTSRKHLAFAWA